MDDPLAPGGVASRLVPKTRRIQRNTGTTYSNQNQAITLK